MRDLNDLYYFAQVVEHRGFAAASRVLHLPKSRLSRRIALLEDQLGVRLIQRSSRHFSVTELGQEFYRHCQAMLVEAGAAEEVIALRRAEPHGVVRISCPMALVEARVGAILADFLLSCPKVSVALESTNRRVDVIGEGFDIAIRARPPPLEDSELVLRVLSTGRWHLVASPALLQSVGLPRVPADLHGLPTVDTVPANGVHVWSLHGPDAARVDLHHDPRMISDDMVALRSAALRGVAVALLPEMLVSAQLASGELVRLLPDWAPTPGIVHAVYPSRRGMLSAVRALLDFLAERLS